MCSMMIILDCLLPSPVIYLVHSSIYNLNSHFYIFFSLLFAFLYNKTRISTFHLKITLFKTYFQISSFQIHISYKETGISKVLFDRIESTFCQSPFIFTEFINKFVRLDYFTLLFEKMFMNLIYMEKVDWEKDICRTSFD